MTDKMTNQEAIDRLKLIRSPYMEVVVDMAIEALTEPKTIIGIDIPYGSDKGIATIFKVADGNISLEEVKEIKPVKRGKWKDVNGDGTAWRCNRCKEISCCNDNFCPNCGAKMDKGGDTE